MVNEQVVQFLDEGEQAQTTFTTKTVNQDTDGNTDMDSSLASWLSRPLEIATITWNSGASPIGFINPWTLFMTDPRNVNKIAYFRNFRCKHMCVKFLINGGPFTYGRMMFSYLPLDPGGTISTYADNLSYDAGTSPTAGHPNAATHRPFILLDPTRSQGGCFELPFIWPYNWLSIPDAEWEKLGQLSYYALTPLSNAGGTTAMNISIKVFAWLVDPYFCVPTTSLPTLPAQSSAGDEYVGMVSKPASALASMAGKIASLPIVGPYARATQIGAGMAAGMAKMVGFSRPSILSDSLPMRPTYVSEMAVTDRSDYIMKLTTDSKQELSISPAIMGLGSGDELDIATIAARETYLGQCTWSVSAAEGTILASVPVTPNQYETVVPAGYTLLNVWLPTAAAFTAWPFKYWRGNVKFRFQIVASQFHRGRLKIVYDPAVAPIATKTNALYSRIIDIQETSDFTITVGWNSLRGMLEVGPLTSTGTFKPNGLSIVPDVLYHNGSITMFVENELMLPIPGVSADISILAWVSMEDAVYNFPSSEILSTITPKAPFVASVGLEPALQNFDVGDMTHVEDLNSVYFGETILSFRALLKRYCLYRYGTVLGLSAAYPTFAFSRFRAFPLLPGSDSDGINATSTAVKTNFISLSLINYIATAFSCYRGGVKYKFHNTTTSVSGGKAFVSLEASVTNTTMAGVALNTTAYNNDTIGSGLNATYNTSLQGIAVTDTTRNPFLETEVPFWTNMKFRNPKAFVSNSSLLATEGVSLIYPEVTTTARVSFLSYVAASEDFTLGFYTGPPAYWLDSYNTY